MALNIDAAALAARHCSKFLIVGVPLVALAAGCVSNHYEVQITPDGRSLERRVVCWREESQDQQQKVGGIAQEELDRMALAYGVQAPTSSAKKFEFNGTFEHDTPNDIGGSGSLTEWVTSFGRTALYVERFRGNDDLTVALDARREAADELADVLIAWFQAELGQDEALTRVQEFFNGALRQDLRNIGAYAWTATVVEDATATDSHSFEMFVRVGQYFLERGYLRTDDFPELLRAVEHTDYARLAVFLRRALLTKLGLPKQQTGWDFLSDPDRIEESLNEHLQHAPGYLKVCEQRGPDNRPLPAEYVGELCLRVVGLELFASADHLKASLRCPAPPFRTNGTWSADEKAVIWTTTIPEFGATSRRALPPLLFACWSVPDEAFQTAHFGKVILRDEPLARYCTWYKGLTAEEAAEWDGFVAKLEAGESLPDRLGHFRFSGDPPPTPENKSPPSLADAARDLILAGLQGP